MKKLSAIVMVLLLICCIGAYAAALTAGRNTKSAQVNYVTIGVKTNTLIYAGAMVAVTNISNVGYAVNASDIGGITVLGCADETVDNRTGASGAGDSGALSIRVKIGTFYWDLADAVTYSNRASIGKIAYVTDNHTVNIAGGGANMIAGIVKDYDRVTGQIAVDVGNMAAAQSSAPASLAVTGAATVGDTLAVASTLGVSGTTTLVALHTTGAITADTTLGVTGKTTLTGGLGGTGWVVTNTFAAGVYTQRIFYAVGNVVTNMTILP